MGGRRYQVRDVARGAGGRWGAVHRGDGAGDPLQDSELSFRAQRGIPEIRERGFLAALEMTGVRGMTDRAVPEGSGSPRDSGFPGRKNAIGHDGGIVRRAARGHSQPGSDCRGRADAIRRGDGTVRVAAGIDSQRGFSLIEIILVVVLIGGIVAFAATRILGGGDRAKYNLAKAQVQTLAEKVGQFEMDTGALPASLDQLVTQPGAVGWLGPYAKESELKDPWNTPYEYRAPGEGQPFDIVSYGADRKPGGDSVNADICNE